MNANMNTFQHAVDADVAERFITATALYEETIRREGTPLDAYINLAVLYWQCTEYGFNAGHRLPLDFIRLAGNRYSAVLDAAEMKFGYSPEIGFWRLYFDYITLGEPEFDEKCKALVAEPGCTLVPYFYLYAEWNEEGRIYRKEAHQLLAECKSCLTTKNRYIISVLESAASTLAVPGGGWQVRR